MSPRRSSRSKTSQPASVTQHTNSSSSSVSSLRADRRSRSTNKPTSPQISDPSNSPSTESRETSSYPQARRTRSNQEVPKIKPDNAHDAAKTKDEGDDEDEEEEITRCVCGQQLRPGIPAAPSDSTKSRSKGKSSNGDTGSPATVQEDDGGLFIQCDVCQVWQHGGCVGIMDDATAPDEYFCELCRKDLHVIMETGTGPKRSTYLPAQDKSSPRPSSSPVPQDTSKRKTEEGRSSRPNAETLAGKRRSTMNSRDASYYEMEQFQRAIEESSALAAASGSRKGKRTRDESDEPDDDNKRQRKESGSSAPSNEKASADEMEEAKEDSKAPASSSTQTVRGAAAQNRRNKELRERDEKREKDRADAAGRRKGRAERRRGDESDPSEEATSRNVSSKGNGQTQTRTPQPSQAPPVAKASHHKKSGRPPARRGRLGRNQYTRDRDTRPSDTPKHPRGGASPARSPNSKDDHDSPHRKVNGGHNQTSNGEGAGKPSKARHMNPSRTTMNDMKRRVAGILDFISHTQVEMAAEVPLGPVKTPSSSASSTNTTAVSLRMPATPGDDPQELQKAVSLGMGDGELKMEQFRALGSVEMMEVLTRRLMKWQGEYGKLGEK
ncbi:MAG: hypothetical protein Q9183_000427 [Haloplaca sp. 2 TL-2023]